jgi:hypothetical protein
MRRGILALLVALVGAGALVSAAVAASGGTRTPTAAEVEHACAPMLREVEARPTATPGAVVPSALATYSLFRRPQTAGDLPPARLGPESLSGSLGYALARFDPADTRLLTQTGAGSVYVVVGQARTLKVPSACARLAPAFVTLFTSEAPQLGHGTAYCLITVSPSGAGDVGGDCYGLGPAFAYDAVTSGSADAGKNVALVPDGVGAVRIRSPGQGTQTLTVTGNVAAGPIVKPPTGPTADIVKAVRRNDWAPIRRYIGRYSAASVSWLTGPSGSVIAAFPRPAHLIDRQVALLRAEVQLTLHPGKDGLGVGQSTSSSSGPTPSGQH